LVRLSPHRLRRIWVFCSRRADAVGSAWLLYWFGYRLTGFAGSSSVAQSWSPMATTRGCCVGTCFAGPPSANPAQPLKAGRRWRPAVAGWGRAVLEACTP